MVHKSTVPRASMHNAIWPARPGGAVYGHGCGWVAGCDQLVHNLRGKSFEGEIQNGFLSAN